MDPVEELAKRLEDLGIPHYKPRQEDARIEDLVFDTWNREYDMWPLNIIRELSGSGPEPPRLVVIPESVEHVVAVVEEAERTGACLTPRCGRSNVVGMLHRPVCAVLDLSRLAGITGFDPESQTVSVLAGTRVHQIEDYLAAHGYTLGYHPQSIRLACVGSSLATLGAGALTPGVGNIEDNLLWARAVVPGMGLVTLGSTRNPRGMAGPVVWGLLLGSEGTLGVVVEAGFRVRRQPKHRVQRSYVYPGFREAVEAARELVQWNPPAVLRVQDEDEALLYYGIDGAVLLLEAWGDKDVAEAQARQADGIARRHGARPVEGLYDKWWERRLDYSQQEKRVLEAGLAFDTIDLAATWPVLPRLREQVRERLLGMEGIYTVFSHASHFYPNGGALYVTIVFERDEAVYWRVWRTVLEEAWRLGASILHHHGIGLVRAGHARIELADSIRLYTKILEAIDEGGVLGWRSLPWLRPS